MKLTTVVIDALKADGKRREIPDDGCAGLYLFVLPSGTRAWYFRYRNAAGKQCRVPLGPYPDVGLAAARGKGDAMRAAVREGRDPAAEKLAERERATMERDRLALGEVAKPSDTFATVWAVFDREHIAPTFRPGTAAKWRRIYKKVLAPRWDARPLVDITSADIYGAMQAVAAKSGPDAADSVLTVCKAFFNWCVAAPRHLLPASPCNGIAKVARKTEDNATDDRILSDEEIRWAWLACDRIAPQFGAVVKLLLLTGARRNEIANMTTAELDKAAALFVLPAIRSKNGRELKIHLSPESLAVLEALPYVENESGFRFSTNKRSPVSGFSKFKNVLDDAMSKVAAEERGEPVAIKPWRLHSLRKTFASGLARLGVSLQVCERCLNHASGSLGGIVAVYNLHSYESECRAAWNAWGSHIAAIVTSKPGDAPSIVPAPSNVVPFERVTA